MFDQAIYNLYPNVVSIFESTDAYDAQGDFVVLDMEIVNVEAKRLQTINNQKKINQENLAYLASTDWYVIRNADSGEAVPIEISEARAAARLLIVE
jgi:hypothetical protein